MEQYDVVVVGAGPAGCAAAKRCVDGGLKTLLVERCKLPRRKACSGMITNASQNYILENFGAIPESVFCSPAALRGGALCFSGMRPAFLNMDCFSPYVWRDRFDHFLAEKSGAGIQDETRFLRLEDTKNGLEVHLKRKDKRTKVLAGHLVGADGGWSPVIHRFAPDVYKGLPFTYACQKYYEGDVEVDERYIYFFILREVPGLPWLNIKDGQVIIGIGNLAGNRFTPAFAAFLDYLKAHFGLRIKKELATEGCHLQLMTPLNRFFPGRGRVLMAGDAMGLMHQGGEGISCALASGGLAGQALVRGMHEETSPLSLYKKLVKPEMERALDQHNPLRMKKSAPSGYYQQPGIFAGFSMAERAKIMRETVRFFKNEFHVPGIGPIIVKNSVRRLFLREYKIGVLE